jgi:hypothetical protein
VDKDFDFDKAGAGLERMTDEWDWDWEKKGTRSYWIFSSYRASNLLKLGIV